MCARVYLVLLYIRNLHFTNGDIYSVYCLSTFVGVALLFIPAVGCEAGTDTGGRFSGEK